MCTWGWVPGMVQRVSNVKVCSSALCAPAPAAERDLQRVHWLQHCSPRLVLSNCSEICSMRAAAATALNRLLPPLSLARGHAWSPSLGEPSAPYKHIRWSEERKVEKQIEILLKMHQALCEKCSRFYMGFNVYILWHKTKSIKVGRHEQLKLSPTLNA